MSERPCLRELAAALGKEVDEAEWSLACKKGGWQIPGGLTREMVKRRLAEHCEGGFAFTHGMLRESLERSARAGGRWHDHHRGCAAMIRQRYPEDATKAERCAYHLLEATELQAALEPLLEAAEYRYQLGDFDGVRAHLLQVERPGPAIDEGNVIYIETGL